MQQEVNDLKTETAPLKQKNTNLRNIIQTNENYSKKNKEVEIANNDLAQYIRRNIVKISGTP